MENKHKKYLVVLGARPNFVKAAPFFARAKDYPDLEFTLLHTGQHFDENMSKIFFDQMNIPKPDIHLDIKAEFHTEKIGKMFSEIKQVIKNGEYSGIIVFGDINSTLAGAVAASHLGLKIFHIESGLRSHDRRMPEEINRVIVDHLSDFLFATEKSGVDNLINEGVPKEKIHLVGNIMIESIEMFKDLFNSSSIISDLSLENEKYIVTTIHRQENTDDENTLKKILSVIQELSRNGKVVMPLHPGTRKKISEWNLDNYLVDVMVIDPLGYIDFMKLIQSSAGVVTDSGGIQEETTHIGIPCCTLRDNTERPVTIEKGTNKLFPLSDIKSEDILHHLNMPVSQKVEIPFWDSGVSKRILDIIAK